jgi:hypothetical protein
MTGVELFHGSCSALVILGHVRNVQPAQSVVQGRKPKPFSDRIGKGISTNVRNRKTLFDDPPQTPTTETSKPPVNRHDSSGLVTDLLDLWIHELKRAAPCLPHLTEEIELGFVSESRVDPSMVEPYDLEVSQTIINETVDDQHSAPWNSTQPNSLDAPSEKHPTACLKALIEPRDTRPVLVPTGQVEEKIEDCADALGRKRFRTFRSDAFEFCQGVAG